MQILFEEYIYRDLFIFVFFRRVLVLVDKEETGVLSENNKEEDLEDNSELKNDNKEDIIEKISPSTSS